MKIKNLNNSVLILNVMRQLPSRPLIPVPDALRPPPMPDSILHSESYGALLLSVDVPCIVVQWRSFANSQQLRFLKDHGLALYTEHARSTRPLGWLCDTRSMGAVRTHDQQWLATDWAGRAFAAGIRHIAYVRPNNVFGQMAIDAQIALLSSNPAYSINPSQHKTLAAAKRWLRQELEKA